MTHVYKQQMLPVFALAAALATVLVFAVPVIAQDELAVNSPGEMATEQARDLRAVLTTDGIEVSAQGDLLRILLPGMTDIQVGEQIAGTAPQTALSLIAESLAQHPDSRVRIASYSQARGALVSNDEAGAKVSFNVATALADYGISTGRITYDGVTETMAGMPEIVSDATWRIAVLISVDE